MLKKSISTINKMVLSIRFNEKKLIFNNSNIYQTIAEIDRSKKPKSY
ncbi:hypothetical protein LEP1GSC077_4207 [Leptospira interrogans str. C10069]|uniref:Uncharacterized protein n=1 Tax=Leptospira interrogans serovar Zanoni str. LT2156 TaxID=1001601 RepID=M6HBJ1_LEPIR|nr:hypothetical protein LEP1GSC077_4207 [Leptospira interrogans str. C10069]EMM94450.1 hypothetical protein LEP1GSC158_5417 [Leptospira interrogans serovar Zanoni str. LT2156]